MKRITRNRGLSNKLKQMTIIVVADAIKGERKTKKSDKSFSKSKHGDLVKNILDYNSSIKEKLFKVSIKPIIYIISISVI